VRQKELTFLRTLLKQPSCGIDADTARLLCLLGASVVLGTNAIPMWLEVSIERHIRGFDAAGDRASPQGSRETEGTSTKGWLA